MLKVCKLKDKLCPELGRVVCSFTVCVYALNTSRVSRVVAKHCRTEGQCFGGGASTAM